MLILPFFIQGGMLVFQQQVKTPSSGGNGFYSTDRSKRATHTLIVLSSGGACLLSVNAVYVYNYGPLMACTISECCLRV